MKHLIFSLFLAASPATAQDTAMELALQWEYVADTVMGGVSTGQVNAETVAGSRAMRLTGTVSLDNNGGFVQMAADLNTDGTPLDAASFTGIELEMIGNAELYDIRLRTTALTRPWQSFRTEIRAPSDWTIVRIPFAAMKAHKTDAAFDPAEVRRIGVVAIGREFEADVAVRAIRLYR